MLAMAAGHSQWASSKGQCECGSSPSVEGGGREELNCGPLPEAPRGPSQCSQGHLLKLPSLALEGAFVKGPSEDKFGKCQ